MDFFLTNPCLGSLSSSLSKKSCNSSPLCAVAPLFVRILVFVFASNEVGVHLCLCLKVGVVPGLPLLVLGLVIGALQEGHAALSRLREL